MDSTNESSAVRSGSEFEGLETQRERVRSLSRQFQRAADGVVIGFTIGLEANAVAKAVDRFRFTGDDEVDRAALSELEARARRGIRGARTQAKGNSTRAVLGTAGIIIGNQQ